MQFLKAGVLYEDLNSLFLKQKLMVLDFLLIMDHCSVDWIYSKIVSQTLLSDSMFFLLICPSVKSFLARFVLFCFTGKQYVAVYIAVTSVCLWKEMNSDPTLLPS